MRKGIKRPERVSSTTPGYQLERQARSDRSAEGIREGSMQACWCTKAADCTGEEHDGVALHPDAHLLGKRCEKMGIRTPRVTREGGQARGAQLCDIDGHTRAHDISTWEETTVHMCTER